MHANSMASIDKLRNEIDTTKRELKNLRKEILKQRANMKTEAENIKSIFSKMTTESSLVKDQSPKHPMTPIGYISSCFNYKNGIPRQPSLCPTAKGTLQIEKSVFNNPHHALIGLQEFSHVWILFLFHENGKTAVKAKVHPPRLNGTSVGVFSTRSPHRPSPIGLSLTRLDKIEGNTLFLSGIDMLDGTPVLDIKPYIPMYDNPTVEEFCVDKKEKGTETKLDLAPVLLISSDQEKLKNVTFPEVFKENEILYSSERCKMPAFLKEAPQKLEVNFTNRALHDLEKLDVTLKHGVDSDKTDMKYLSSDIKKTITEVLENDPRSIYRREKCSDKLYYFYIYNFHVTCWFDQTLAEVLRIKSYVMPQKKSILT